MAFTYINRIGKTYYLLQGTTKKGNPKYTFSQKSDGKGEPVEDIPEGFEVYEHPRNAQVFLRKKRPQHITDLEKHLVKKHVDKLKREYRYLVDCKDRNITIYESHLNMKRMTNIFKEFFQFVTTSKTH